MICDLRRIPALLLLVLVFLLPSGLQAQKVNMESPPFFKRNQPSGVHKNAIQFEVTELPDLPPISEEQPPGWLYYWNFNDGDYSLEARPFHVFNQAGTYKVRLELTPVYTDEFEDDVRYIDTTIVLTASDITSRLPNARPEISGSLSLLNNRCPVPGDSVTFIITYQNVCPAPVGGGISFRLRDGDFQFGRDQRFHGESEVKETMIVTRAWDSLREWKWSFSALGPGEQRNLFLVMKTDSPLSGYRIV